MFNVSRIIIVLILVGGIAAVAFFMEKKQAFKDVSPEKEQERSKTWLSKTGSIIFYSFLLAIVLFFVIMYIIWKIKYAG